jgi:hypothetical protein
LDVGTTTTSLPGKATPANPKLGILSVTSTLAADILAAVNTEVESFPGRGILLVGHPMPAQT